MVMNKKASKTYKFFLLQIAFFSLKFVATVVNSSSIILSDVITESSISLAKCFPFSILHVAGFQI